jgi:hypothetical protein
MMLIHLPKFTSARFLALCLCWALPLAAPAQEPRIVHYDWLTAGAVSGSQVLQIHDDGKRAADFQFNDRGRGPKIHEELITAPDGTLLELEISGHSYMGAPAAETFRVEDGKAHWESTLERGEAQAGGFYSGNDGTPEQLAVLARALLQAPGQRLTVLPAGSASISKVAEPHLGLDGAGATGLGRNPGAPAGDPGPRGKGVSPRPGEGTDPRIAGQLGHTQRVGAGRGERHAAGRKSGGGVGGPYPAGRG